MKRERVARSSGSMRAAVISSPRSRRRTRSANAAGAAAGVVTRMGVPGRVDAIAVSRSVDDVTTISVSSGISSNGASVTLISNPERSTRRSNLRQVWSQSPGSDSWRYAHTIRLMIRGVRSAMASCAVGAWSSTVSVASGSIGIHSPGWRANPRAKTPL